MAQLTEAPNLADFGFNEGERGVHTSRTMMFAELCMVLDSISGEISPTAVKNQIVSENVLGKASMSGRTQSARKLIELYSFDPQKPLFRAFINLWNSGQSGRPLLALLMAMARDGVLFSTAEWIASLPKGSRVFPEDIVEVLQSGFCARYNKTTLKSTAQNIASTYKQSGHFAGHYPKVRGKTEADSASLSFAVAIASHKGLRGQTILASVWVRLLDFDPVELSLALIKGHQQGLLTYRKIGHVVELLPQLPDLEAETR